MTATSTTTPPSAPQLKKQPRQDGLLSVIERAHPAQSPAKIPLGGSHDADNHSTSTSMLPAQSPYRPLWTAEDIAAYGQLAVGTVRNWSSQAYIQRNGALLPPAIHIGRAVRWDPDAVIAVLNPKV
jgi:hypothetical protein